MKKYCLALSISLVLGNQVANANPTGAQVVQGAASFSTPSANVLNVTNSHNAIINWQRFNIGAGQTTNFIQPSAGSSVLNRVVTNAPSQILGNLNSNGRVFLINQNGILMGQGARINTNGFFGSTLNITDSDFLNGKLKFDGGGLGGIENQGFIHAGEDGNIVLIAPDIENGGVLEVDNGNVILAAGKSITITSLENSAIEFEVSSPENSVTNLGQIIAHRGAASLFAGTLKHSGSIRANGLVQDADGTIRLVATDRNEISGQVDVSGDMGGRIEILGDVVDVRDGAIVDASGANGGGEILIGGDQQGLNPDIQNATSTTIAAGAQVNADATDTGNGGKVIVFAENDVHVHGEVTARGGTNGGDGGFIETSGLQVLDITNTPDATAAAGNAGTWLIDPFDITIQAAGTGSVDTNIAVTNLGGATIRTSNADSAILTTDTIATALSGGISVIVQTGAGGTQQGNITINDPIDAGPSVSLVSLTLNAHNDINVNADITNSGFGYDLVLNSNSDATGGGQINFATATLNVGGSISLDGPAFINGITDFSGGNVILADVLTVNPGGQFLKGFGQFSGAGSFINDGTATFSGGCGDGCTSVDMDVPFTNSNVLRLDEVYFNVNNTMTNSGLIDLVPTIFQDGPGLKIGNGLLAGSLILNPGSGFTGGQGTDITVGPLGVLDVQTPTVLDPDTSLTLFNGTIDNFHNLTILDQAQVFIDGGTLSGPGNFIVDLLDEPTITVSGTNPLTINDLVMNLGGADLLWNPSGPNGDIVLNNSQLIIEDRMEISSSDPGAAITGTGSELIIGADSFLTQFSSVNTNIDVPISSVEGHIQLFGGGGITLPGDLTIRNGGSLGGFGTLTLTGPGTLTIGSGGGIDPGTDATIGGIGTLTVDGDVVFEADSRAVFEINNIGTGGWDIFSIQGGLTVNSGSSLFVLWDDFATQSTQVGSSFDLVNIRDGRTGNFTNILNPVSVVSSTLGGGANTINYQINVLAAGPVFFWDGEGGNSSWSTAANWNNSLGTNNQIPGTNDLVVVEAGTFANPVQLTSLEPASGGLGSTQIEGFFSIGSGGNLNVGGNLVTRADMEIRDGGTISGTGTWRNLGFTDINGANNTLTVANIENHAAMVWAQLGATNSLLNVSSNLTNYGSLLFFAPQTLSNTLNFTSPSGLLNQGLLGFDSSQGITINGAFSNLATGEVIIGGGNVAFNADTSLDGFLNIAPGSQVSFEGGSHSFANSFAQSGQMVFNGGTFTGQFNHAAAASLDIGAAASDVIFDAFTLDSFGTVVFTSAGNDLVLNNGSQLRINNSLFLQHGSNNADITGDGTELLVNNIGASIDLQSANDINLAVALLSDGDLNVNNGIFIVQRGADLLSGNLNIASGAEFRVDAGLVTLGSSFGQVTGGGQLSLLNSGILDFDVASSVSKDISSLQSLNINDGVLLLQDGSGVALPSIVNVSGNSSVIQGFGNLTIDPGVQINWNGGTLIGGPSQLIVDNQGTIDVFASQSLILNQTDLAMNGPGILTGAGQIVIPVGSQLSTAATDIAALSLAGGTLSANNLNYAGVFGWQSGTVSGQGLTTTGSATVLGGTLDVQWIAAGTSDVIGSIAGANGAISIPANAILTGGNGGAVVDFNVSTVLNGGTLIADNLDITGSFGWNTGTIFIAQGGSFSVAGQNLVLDEVGDVLQGFGTFLGNVDNQAGIVTPGRADIQNSIFLPGALSVAGNFTQGTNGDLIMKLDSTPAGLVHDSLNVSGLFSAGGDVNFAIVNNTSITEIALLLDQSFRPFNFTGGFTGSFDSVAIPDGLNFVLAADGTISITSDNLQLIEISNQLEVLLSNDNLDHSEVVVAMRFIEDEFVLALLDDEEDEEGRRAPRLVCK